MHSSLGIILASLLAAFVCIQGLAIKSRWNGVNEEVYSKYVCNGKENGVKIMVVGSCSKYYECKSGESSIKTCASPNKFFDSSAGKCVATSSCIEPKGECSTAKPKPTKPCNNKVTTTTTTTPAPRPAQESSTKKTRKPSKTTKKSL